MAVRSLTFASIFVLAFVACGGDDKTSSSSGDPTSTGTPTDPTGGTTSGGTSGTTPPDPGGSGAGDAGGATPPTTKSVKFIAMGDTGTGSNDQLKIGNTISALCQTRGCDFVQLLGDNLYDSGASSVDDTIWQDKFEVPYAAVNLDFWAVLGNHDYGHNGLGTDWGKGKNEIEYTKKSTKWKMPAAYWERTVENVHMIGLDTNMMMFGQDSNQKKDIPSWITKSTAPWRIAFGHHPYKSNGPHGNAGTYDKIPIGPPSGNGVKSFLEDNICGKVDLYLAGHDHSRQWLNVSCKGTELAVSGAGAKATELEGSNPALFQSLELGFLYIVVEGKKLTAEFIDENGKTEFTHTITKP